MGRAKATLWIGTARAIATATAATSAASYQAPAKAAPLSLNSAISFEYFHEHGDPLDQSCQVDQVVVLRRNPRGVVVRQSFERNIVAIEQPGDCADRRSSDPVRRRDERNDDIPGEAA